MSRRTVLVAGAAGALGFRIAQRLVARGERVVATYRTPRPEALTALAQMGCELQPLDLADVFISAKAIAAADAAVLTPILTASGPAARRAIAIGGKRIVVFSSNNVTVDADAPVYAALRAEEAALRDAGGDWVLVRPTMIYGHPGDGNMSRLIRLAQQRPVLPMPGSGRALQQPVHVDDLADLAVALLDAEHGMLGEARIAPAAGPRALTQRAVYEAVRRAAGRNPPIVAVPAPPLAVAAGLAQSLRLPFPLTPAQVARLERDKTPPADLPPPACWKAQTSLEDGLARLAESLGSAPHA